MSDLDVYASTRVLGGSFRDESPRETFLSYGGSPVCRNCGFSRAQHSYELWCSDIELRAMITPGLELTPMQDLHPVSVARSQLGDLMNSMNTAQGV